MGATSDCINTKTGKKVSKPLMEKKRRARINKCLDQLKSLLENHYSNNIRKRKLEKADILELTVKHLKHQQKIQGSSVNSEVSDYQAGFRSCLAGVNQYLLMADNSKGSSRLCMLTHLSSNLRCAGEQILKSSTMDSNLGKHRAEASKTRATVPLARYVRSFNPHTSTGHYSQSTGITAELPCSGDNQACTKTTQEKKGSSLPHKNEDRSIVQGRNEVVEILSRNIWRPW